MLIRPFGNSWTLVPTLVFDIQEYLKEMFPDGHWKSYDVKQFYIFVRNVMMLHKRPVIDKLYLSLEDDYLDCERNLIIDVGDDIRMVLTSALDNQAKEIKYCDVSYELSNFLDFPSFTSQSLVTLDLCHCYIGCQPEVNLGSLKKLILGYITMSEEAFQHFLSGCPSLQELSIEQPQDMTDLRFSAPNIHKLSLVLLQGDETDDPWLLDFPNLKSLDLDLGQIPDVVDVSSVRNVYLKGLCYAMDDMDGRRMLKTFLEKFAGAEVIQISHYDSELFLHAIDDLSPLQNSWKRVVLELKVLCRSCLLGFYQLMRSSKQLEELIIYTSPDMTAKNVCNTPGLFSRQGFEANTYLRPLEITYPCVMPKLKTITLHGYVKPWKHQLELVEFLLKTATVLDKLVIVPKKSGLIAEKLDFVMCVSSFPRSSPSARVLFH